MTKTSEELLLDELENEARIVREFIALQKKRQGSGLPTQKPAVPAVNKSDKKEKRKYVLKNKASGVGQYTLAVHEIFKGIVGYVPSEEIKELFHKRFPHLEKTHADTIVRDILSKRDSRGSFIEAKENPAGGRGLLYGLKK